LGSHARYARVVDQIVRETYEGLEIEPPPPAPLT
jgi:hypothetical protein